MRVANTVSVLGVKSYRKKDRFLAPTLVPIVLARRNISHSYCSHRRRRSKRNFVAAGPSLVTSARLPLFDETETEQLDSQRAVTFEHVISILSHKLDRLHSGQLVLRAQVKYLRESLPMRRRPLSRWVQQMHVAVTYSRRNGICPCCQETPVCNESGRLLGAEFDHWHARNRARAEETWLVCSACNARLNDTEFKASIRSAFESYQIALRRMLQTRQSALTDVPQSAAS
jgi:hypothetical protein